jgi:hypothetical protein
MWTVIADQTNIYTENRILNEHLKQKSRHKKWRPVSDDELKVFFPLVITMGLIRKGDLDAIGQLMKLYAHQYSAK